MKVVLDGTTKRYNGNEAGLRIDDDDNEVATNEDPTAI
jgi:hypothetical protein